MEKSYKADKGLCLGNSRSTKKDQTILWEKPIQTEESSVTAKKQNASNSTVTASD